MNYLRDLRLAQPPNAVSASAPAIHQAALPVRADIAAGITTRARMMPPAAAQTASESRFIAMPKSLHP